MTQTTDTRTCPTCGHCSRIYRRRLTSVAARALIALYRERGTAYGHMPTIARKHLADVQGQGGYLVLAAHWRLMVEERRTRPDGGRAGWWAVTERGRLWVLGRTSVPGYAVIRAGRCLGLEGDPITVTQALGQHFDLVDLLGPAHGDPAGQAVLFPAAPEAA